MHACVYDNGHSLGNMRDILAHSCTILISSEVGQSSLAPFSMLYLFVKAGKSFPYDP